MFFLKIKSPFLKGLFLFYLFFYVNYLYGVEVKKCAGSIGNKNICVDKIKTRDEIYAGEIYNNNKQGFGVLLNNDNEFFLGYFDNNKKSGVGKFEFYDGSKYIGNFKNDIPYGYGVFFHLNGDRYVGEFDGWKRNGVGAYIYSSGIIAKQGIWENDRLVKKNKIDIEILSSIEAAFIEEISKNDNKINFYKNIILSEVKLNLNSDLSFLYAYFSENDKNKITIILNEDTTSLSINGNEYGRKDKGRHVIIYPKSKVGNDKLKIKAISVFGNSQELELENVIDSSESIKDAIFLNPQKLKKSKTEEAIAIIIGIEKYKNVSEASFSNNDAVLFKEYAIRSLGVAESRIKLHLDKDAEKIDILKTLKVWLPTQIIPGKTDVYIFYSGHGLPSVDGKGFYLLPYDSDTDFLDETAIRESKLIEELQKLSPKSVKIFLDSCFVGQNKQGDTLLPGARPIILKSNKDNFPANFTVIAASSSNQISWSSQDLKHGIFSFYLMKGMEGDADINNDGEINAGELINYLKQKVAKQAALNNHIQNPQLIGDSDTRISGKKILD